MKSKPPCLAIYNLDYLVNLPAQQDVQPLCSLPGDGVTLLQSDASERVQGPESNGDPGWRYRVFLRLTISIGQWFVARVIDHA